MRTGLGNVLWFMREPGTRTDCPPGKKLRAQAAALHAGLAAAGAILLLAANASFAEVATWTRWEHSLTSKADYTAPYQQVSLAVTYTAPSGREFECCGFWDGGRTHKIRFMFRQSGTWSWKTTCSNARDSGLHEQRGAVNVVEYAGDNRLFRNGHLKVSDNGRHLAYANGKPFLWIGDTPWSAFITATQNEWERYLRNRADNSFTVVQVHCGGCWEWVGQLNTDRLGNPPFSGSGSSLQWNPAYWRQVDRKVQAANDLGLLVYVYAVRQPGPGFPADDVPQVARFARNLAARLMGNFVLYSPMADDVWTPQADAAGQALHRTAPMHMISAHPRFFLEPAVVSHGRDYIDLVGLQTGEGWQHDPYKKEKPLPWSPSLAARNAIQWPLALYRLRPAKPVINQEGPYDHPPYSLDSGRAAPLPTRKAGYWSFLSGAPGLSYGCFGIWNWGRPVRWMPSYDFQAALDVESVRHMKLLAEFFGSIAWWTLEPAHELVVGQSDDWMRKMVLAKSASGDLAVAYLPDNAQITVDMTGFPVSMQAAWFNPLSGGYQPVYRAISTTGRRAFVRPSGWQDAILVLRKQSAD